MEEYGDRIENRAKAMAAAGSDARMNGCDLPVIINSGSGNQGMTASLPVIEYAKELKCSREKLYRALLLSNLVTLHQKTGIGRLSAYCGAVSAGAGAGAGIAYLEGGDLKVVAHTLVNALAITSGIVCDGAKASCAAKIAVAVDTGILGYKMYKKGQQFYGGDGLVAKGVENTIRNIGRLGKEGMKGDGQGNYQNYDGVTLLLTRLCHLVKQVRTPPERPADGVVGCVYESSVPGRLSWFGAAGEDKVCGAHSRSVKCIALLSS